MFKAGPGNHGGVIRTQCRCRLDQCHASGRCKGGQCRADGAVGGNPAGDDQRANVWVGGARHVDGVFGPCNQRFRNGLLERSGEIGRAPGIKRCIERLDGTPDTGLEAGKGKITAGPVRHRTRKIKFLRIAAFGGFLEQGAAGIAEPKHFSGLVEGLAGGIVDGRAEPCIAADTLADEQLTMTPGNQ